MNKLLLLFLLFFPFLTFASFPMKLNYSDTIRKNGKVYITIYENLEDVSSIKYKQTKLKRTKDEILQKNKNKTIIGSLLSFWIIAVVLAAILLIALFKAFLESLNSY